MAQPLAAPYCQFFDSNGDPLSGGKVYSYEAGTSTPKDTYTDSSATTPNANPVILDSAGRAAIWLNGAYKITVTDSNDVVIRTEDDISSATATGNMNTTQYDPANVQEQLVGLTAVQTLTNKTLVKPDIVGTTTNDNAAAGSVGELIQSSVLSGSAVSLTSSTSVDVTSISLTAGDWDVSGVSQFIANAATTATKFGGAISLTSATFPGIPGTGIYWTLTISQSAGAEMPTMPTGDVRISVATTTTVYLVARATFAVNTMSAFGYIRARRVR